MGRLLDWRKHFVCMVLNPTTQMSALVFDRPQKVQSVDMKGGCWAVTVNFESISVKVVRLIGVLHKSVIIEPPPAAVQALATGAPPAQEPPPPPQQIQQAWPKLPAGFPQDLCLLDSDTLLPAQQALTEQAPAQQAAPPPQAPPPPPVPQPPCYKMVTRVYRGSLPTEDERAGGRFEWLEVPWAVPDYDHSTLPWFDHDVYTSKSLAACGVAPYFRGSGLLMHGEKPRQLLARYKHNTGLLLGCAWLRNAIWAELAKLHKTTPNWQLYCGLIVTDRVDCTLATMNGPQRSYISTHWQEVQLLLDGLHLQCLQHGFMHLDMSSHTIGCRFAPDLKTCRLYFIDFSKAIKDVCLDKLNSLGQAEKTEVLAMINALTEGLTRKALDETEPGGWLARFVDRWVTLT